MSTGCRSGTTSARPMTDPDSRSEDRTGVRPPARRVPSRGRREPRTSCCRTGDVTPPVVDDREISPARKCWKQRKCAGESGKMLETAEKSAGRPRGCDSAGTEELLDPPQENSFKVKSFSVPLCALCVSVVNTHGQTAMSGIVWLRRCVPLAPKAVASRHRTPKQNTPNGECGYAAPLPILHGDERENRRCPTTSISSRSG